MTNHVKCRHGRILINGSFAIVKMLVSKSVNKRVDQTSKIKAFVYIPPKALK